jgi:diguanylate cyclase (GGDEF)-like protein
LAKSLAFKSLSVTWLLFAKPLLSVFDISQQGVSVAMCFMVINKSDRRLNSMGDTALERVESIDFEKTLDKSVLAAELVAQSAQELADVNLILQDELHATQAPPAVQLAIIKSQSVEDKVNQASLHLSTVNTVLAAELAERSDLEVRLATAQADEDTARTASLHDALTGLPNRLLLDDRLTQGMANAARHGSMLALVFIDLNKFKCVNDTYGHAAGDFVLRLISQRLKACTREVDTVSRHGGDEFLLILSDLHSKDDLTSVVSYVLEAISQPCDLATFGATSGFVVTASAGVAIFPQDGTDGAKLIGAADAAMYSAKKSGTGMSFQS